jgi:hypothetical protein
MRMRKISGKIKIINERKLWRDKIGKEERKRKMKEEKREMKIEGERERKVKKE